MPVHTCILVEFLRWHQMMTLISNSYWLDENFDDQCCTSSYLCTEQWYLQMWHYCQPINLNDIVLLWKSRRCALLFFFYQKFKEARKDFFDQYLRIDKIHMDDIHTHLWGDDSLLCMKRKTTCFVLYKSIFK